MAEAYRPAKKPEEVALIAGRYRVDKILGRGGVAAVYGASDESTGKVVAANSCGRPKAGQANSTFRT